MSSRAAKRVIGALIVTIGAAGVLFLDARPLAEANLSSGQSALAQYSAGASPTTSAAATDTPEPLPSDSPSPSASPSPTPSPSATPIARVLAEVNAVP